jgi:hypothetical protein
MNGERKFSVRHPESGRGRLCVRECKGRACWRSALRLVRKELHRPAWQVQVVKSEPFALDPSA